MRKISRWNPVLNLFLLILALLTFYPLIFTVLTSFKDNEQFYADFWGPANPIIWKNYIDAFKEISPYMVNSVIICALSIVGILITTSLSAYTFARLRFPCKEIAYLAILALLMIPSMLQLVPQFILLRDLGLLNSYAGVIIGYIAGQQAFSIFIMRAFFDTQPEELFEAARIDGCSEIQAYYRIALPLIKPILGTVAIMTLLAMWNDYLWPRIVTSDPSKFTVALGLLGYTSAFNYKMILYGPMFAAFVVASLPLVVLFLILMKSFIEGLTAGAVKA